MSNLGDYQRVVQLAKKVGGPKRLAGITLALGFGVFRGVEAGGKYVIRRMNTPTVPRISTGKVFDVNRDGSCTGLDLKAGDQFRVLACDDDAILIERLGDAGSPYMVSEAFLIAVSNYSPGASA